ncbi:MAG: ABC transporter ATP-binding protein [Planctomycetota bacterium]|nr:ABC transporter ATP-binding protein [Planctomycetota bacterium]
MMMQTATSERTADAGEREGALLVADDVHKTYRMGRVDVPVLRGVSLDVQAGEWVAVLGASGSGKSTMLHLLGGLDRPDRRTSEGGSGGEIRFEGRALRSMSARELDRYRCTRVGFVFQFYHLLPELTVVENVAVGAMIRLGRFGWISQGASQRERAKELLTALGMDHRLGHRPAALSGGERQRVAIARALMNDPNVLLADEPTGNLDRATGERILDGIETLHRERGQTMVMVTHDPAVAERADRRILLRDGRVVEV